MKIPIAELPKTTNSWIEERGVFLEACGFQSYEEYLTSDLWDFVRSNLRAIEEFRQCVCCGSVNGLAWHHREYSFAVMVGNFSVTFGGEWRGASVPAIHSPIVRVCSACHRAIHVKDDEWVIGLWEVDSRLRLLQELCANKSHPDAVSRLDEPLAAASYEDGEM